MNYCFLCNNFLAQYKNTSDIKTSIKNYINNYYNTAKNLRVKDIVKLDWRKVLNR